MNFEKTISCFFFYSLIQKLIWPKYWPHQDVRPRQRCIHKMPWGYPCGVFQALFPVYKQWCKNWHSQHQQTIGACTNPQQCPTKGKPKPPPRPGGRSQPPRSCQACVDWGSALETVEYTDQTRGIVTSLAWTNIDPTVLFQDPVEVAKAFGIKLFKGQPPPSTFHEFGHS